eukprot:gene22178-biopygen22224
MPPLGDHGTSGVQRIASACSKVLPRRRESSSLLAPMGDEHLLFQPRLCSDTRERAVGEAAQLARGQHPQHTSKSSSAPAAPVAKGPLHPWLRSFLSRCAGSVLFGGFSLPPVGPVLAFWRLWFRNRCGRCVCRGLEMPFYVDRLVRDSTFIWSSCLLMLLGLYFALVFPVLFSAGERCLSALPPAGSRQLPAPWGSSLGSPAASALSASSAFHSSAARSLSSSAAALTWQQRPQCPWGAQAPRTAWFCRGSSSEPGLLCLFSSCSLVQ